jgi:N-methylhydantoinase B/oxoprolinase/acetone carboxylase alpha subunit
MSASTQIERGEPSQDEPFDPITLAVIANRLDGICRQMMNTLLRSGRSSLIAIARDFSCSIVSSEHELVAAAEAIPIHVIGSEALAQSMEDLHPGFREGDAYLHNDPYLGNTHHADYNILVPVFVDGEHVFTACAKGHQADCGNALPSTYMPTAADIYEEGALSFPCVKVQRDYEDVDDIIRIAKRRIRVPEVWYGDYLAILGAARVGERALKELCAKYGIATVRRFVTEWLNYSEERMRDAIGELPAGRWTGATYHDPFPGNPPEGLPLTTEITVDPDAGAVVVDMTGNIDCVPNGLNLSATTARSAPIAALCFSLKQVPHNSGSFRCIDVKIRDNCVAGRPIPPTSCSLATGNVASRVINMTQAALGEISDRHGLAEGATGYPPCFAVISGTDPRRDDAPYVTQLFLGTAGGPGGPVADGWLNYLQGTSSGAMYIDSVEADEQKYPIIIRECRVTPDSAGAGRRRGAPGTTCVYGPLPGARLRANYSLDGAIHVPQGVRGGIAGVAAGAFLVAPDGSVQELPDLVVDREILQGEFLGSRASGGGGYGDPMTREAQRVLDDVVEGWVSIEAAERVYGVAVSGDPERPETLTVDAAATERLRRGE